MDDEMVLNFSVEAPKPAKKVITKKPTTGAAAPKVEHTKGSQRAERPDAKAFRPSAGSNPSPGSSRPTPGSKPNSPWASKGAGAAGGQRGAKPSSKAENLKSRLAGGDDAAMYVDNDEEGDVASMIAMMSKRDADMEGELKVSNPGMAAQDGEGVVDFDDDMEGQKQNNNKKRKSTSADAGSNSAPASSNGKPGQTGKPRTAARPDVKVRDSGVGAHQLPTNARLVPGSLTHTQRGAQAAELFLPLVPPPVSAPAPAPGDKSDEKKAKRQKKSKAEAATGDEAAEVAAEVAVEGAVAAPAAVGSWESLGLEKRMCEQLAFLKFEQPTRVQCASVPPLLAGRDVLVRAATGSGKTLAYLVPCIHDLGSQEPRLSRAEGTYALVVAPTRELCLQIQDVALQLLRRFHWLVTGVVIGGENRTHEKARLRKGITVLVATPGRLADHLQSTASFKTNELRWLILDEADRLLDLGFEARLTDILKTLDDRRGKGVSGQRRTTALLSATMHSKLAGLAAVSLNDPVTVGFTMTQGEGGMSLIESAHPSKTGGPEGTKLGNILEAGGETYVLPSQLRQHFMEVEAKQRLVTLAGLLRQKLLGSSHMGGGKAPAAPVKRKAVVFLSSCDGVELHHTLLGGNAWRSAAGGPLLGADMPLLKLHGDMPQAQRTAAFVTFLAANCAVLLCTDVAARGLDIPDVTMIVQYDVPGAPEDYVHRVGRTARMGHTGEAMLMLMPHERPYVELLAAKGVKLEEMAAEGPLRWLPQGATTMDDDYAAKHSKATKVQGSRPMAAAFNLQNKVMQAVAADPPLRDLAHDAFRSFVRSYATHPANVKHIFHVRNLHLGHVAFAHGLKETPTMLGSSGSARDRKLVKAQGLASKQRVARKALYHKAVALRAE